MSKDWKPTFIGNFRSGTTLLANLLGLHPELATWFETKLFCDALRWARVLSNPETLPEEERLIRPDQSQGFSARAVYERMSEDFILTAQRLSGVTHHGKAPHERYPLGHDAVAYSLHEGQAALDGWFEKVIAVSEKPQAILEETGSLIQQLGKLHAEASGKPFWINKTPEIPRFADELRAGLGRVRIILMIRDGREVVRSASALGWADAERLAMWWKQMIMETRSAMRDFPEDYLEVKYESLVVHPEPVLDDVLAFLGLQPNGRDLWQRYVESGSGRVKPAYSGCPLDVGLVDRCLLETLGYTTAGDEGQ